MSRVAVACLVGLVFIPSIASAGACDVLRSGSMPPVTTFSSVLERLKQVDLKKDEFETTEAFNARVSAASASLFSGSQEIAVALKVDPEKLKFNADAGVMTLSLWGATGSCRVSEFGVPEPVKAVRYGPQSRYLNSGVCISQVVSRTAGEPYTGSNSYGATVEIEVSNVRAEGVLLGFGDSDTNPFTGEEEDTLSSYKKDLFSLILPADSARSLKSNGALVVVLRPKSPYYYQNVDSNSPTIRFPVKINTTTDLLIGDLVCAGLGDVATGRVYGSVQPQ